jgi:tRNA pseudouridine38-40 synthase
VSYLCGMRYFIELSYDGTNFSGWQKQPNAPSVQEEIEKALTVVLRHDVALVGSSRTDAGVHATQQFAHFDLPAPIKDPDRLIHSLNLMLPRAIGIQRIFAVKDTTHARFEATHRCYEYRIVCQKNPFLTNFALVTTVHLDLQAMNQAAALLLQYQDFECFSKTHTDVKTFVCHIQYAFWEERAPGLLVFCIKSNRFLRGMVRAIVGTLLQVGQGRLTAAQFEQIIVSKNRKNAAAQAPAHGLFLTEVGYQENNL